jgi:predicted HTH transcriptional regulator
LITGEESADGGCLFSSEALREAVINAVIHRDYSKCGESVRVFYYVDQVEVHSPGLLLPGITVEQMERGMVQSKLLNPVHEQRLIKAVQHVNEYGFITNTTYRALTGISDRTAHRDLETLVERGRLKGIGQK